MYVTLFALSFAQHFLKPKYHSQADLSPTIDNLVIMEYSEERPPLFMTKGMSCRIVNYYRGDRSRCPISAGGGDRPLRKRHGDKAAQSQLSANEQQNKVEERPPRLLGPNQYGSIKSAADLIGITSMKKKKKSKDALTEAKKAKEKNAINVLPEGVTEILHQKVHGPFIGEVEDGKTQTGLISNLFAAPMFSHESEPTDFLMILGQVTRSTPSASSSLSSVNAGSTNGGGLGVFLRPVPPNIYCVGQTEPRVKVFAPNTNDEKKASFPLNQCLATHSLVMSLTLPFPIIAVCQRLCALPGREAHRQKDGSRRPRSNLRRHQGPSFCQHLHPPRPAPHTH